MPAAVRLGIDVGAHTTKAVLALPDGTRLPLMVDGRPAMPSGVFVDPDGGPLLTGVPGQIRGLEQPGSYVPDLPACLSAGQLLVDGRALDASDLYAAALTAVAAEATRIASRPVSSAVVAIPPSWGPRRRARIHQAATTAGLTDVALVTTPCAVAAHHYQNVPTDDSCLLVCDAGHSALQVTVLHATAAGVQQLATAEVPDAAGKHLDELIAAHAARTATVSDADYFRTTSNRLTADDPQWTPVLLAAREAKESLSGLTRTVVVLPDPFQPAVLDRTSLLDLTKPATTRLADTVADLLAATDIDRHHLQRVILTGGGAYLPGLAAALADATGQTPAVPARTDIAAADGALTYAGQPTQVEIPLAPVILPAIRARPQDLAGPLLIGGSSLALIAFALMTMWTSGSTATSIGVHLSTYLIAAASVLVMVAALAAAQLVPSLYLIGHTTADHTATALVRRSYAAAAVLGLTTAVLYGLGVGALTGRTDRDYLSAILPAVPIAVAGLLIAGLAPFILATTLPTWLRHQRPRLIPAVLATGGILAMHYAVNTTSQLIPLGLAAALRLGAAATGVAIALTVTHRPFLRLAAAALLAIGCATVASLDNVAAITYGYVAALEWWALTVTARTIRAAHPHLTDRMRKLLASQAPGRDHTNPDDRHPR